MESLRQIGIGILVAVFSIILILGGFSLSMAEGNLAGNPTATGTFVLIIPSSPPTTPTVTVEATESPVPTELSAPTSTTLPTNTALPTVIQFPTVISQSTLSLACSLPYGWVGILVQPYDTLGTLAQTYQMSQYAILQGNCLTSDQIKPGIVLYVQPRATATYIVNSVPCGAPYGWINYYVVAGDTLYNIGGRYRVSVAELQNANCLGSSTNLMVGKVLKVPNVATTVPLMTSTAYPTETVHPTEPAATQTSVPTLTTEPPTAIPPTAIPDAPTATPYSSTGPG